MRALLRSPVIGVLLLAVLAGWSLWSRPDAPEAASGVAACLVLGGGLVGGWLLGRLDPVAPGLLALAVAVGAFVITWPDSLSGSPLAPPLDYMNANGELALCGAAGAVLATVARPSPWRAVAGGIAVVTAIGCAVLGAQAAAVAALLLVGWSVLRHVGPSWAWLVGGVALLVVPVLLTVAWAAEWLGRPAAAVAVLSENRFDLWHEAYGLTFDHPVSGVGPGRFSLEAPTAADPDLAWAHSYVLQIGAELGLVGVGLLTLLLAWGVASLGRRTVLLAILLLPATVDYVLQFGGVLLLLSLVVGGALASGAGKPWLTPPSP